MAEENSFRLDRECACGAKGWIAVCESVTSGSADPVRRVEDCGGAFERDATSNVVICRICGEPVATR
jgi:hypothetical protein